jgi:hypothetical protein
VEVASFRCVTVTWPDDVDEILASDLTAGFTYLTPAKGAVIVPMAPLGLHDREAGTVTVTTSQGLWKKLERIRRNPEVALAYHAREHGFSDRAGFVLVQGRASFPIEPDREWLESITPQWDRFLLPKRGGLLGRALDVYYWQRVPITIQVERVVAYPDDAATEDPRVFGAPLVDACPAQKAPKGGTEPRVDMAKALAHAQRLPHTLLGWRGHDGFPEVVPVEAIEASTQGLRLRVPPGAVPASGRRAGLTSHRFWPQMVGQEQRIHTGWLSSDGAGAVTYAPHTKGGYLLPPSKVVFYAGCASLATRMRAARNAGVAA